MRAFRHLLIAFAAGVIVASGAAAQAAVPTGQTVDGIHCDAMEGAVLDSHQHLAILDHGIPVPVPPDVGRPLMAQCLYWIHTHTPDGIIHIESPNFKTFTLGNFFDVWGEPLSRTEVAGAKPKRGEKVVVWVDGRAYAGDPRTIELTNHLDITIEIGPPQQKPAPFTAWNGN